jgi:WXG100 family type VII secretion target
MADEIKADYSQLEQIRSRFGNEEQAVYQVHMNLIKPFDQLENGQGWIGKGSDAFYREMHDVVFPALTRLQAALSEAGEKTKKIADTMRQAEQDAASPFRTQ